MSVQFSAVQSRRSVSVFTIHVVVSQLKLALSLTY